ncbi:MAG TPA: butyrate kinase [Bacteroidales bacterium]|nr:MAG: butyrate kinase [Bacteroidetes bacterium GWF2_33_38]OFY70046.1 MAG: butyrate kinase [Bacteroidetes bacterium RIFOXYA12_FULL_33_9]OFY88209.1 MAG: butyrate kinase [Bacteroidetes bacterium RIFOXYA2_FULL_33_7]HBF87570.1 butyrate kinase [Bacteroidales bacterium]
MEVRNKLILAINPGSTSTKIAIYQNNKLMFIKNIKHSEDDLKDFQNISDQFQFRKDIILKELKEADINIEEIDAVVGRGGLLKPIPSGVYEVNEKMLEDLKVGVLGQHASNLGGMIANDIAKSLSNTRAFIADPVVVDELQDVARVSGHPEFERISIFHALNHKAIARTHARSVGARYEDMNLIVVHLGGGISVGAHKKGKVIDVNQALDGDGPFSPERSGSLPVGELVKLCFSGKYTQKEIKKMIVGKGGFVAYLGTNNAYEVEMRVKEGDKKAILIHRAMAYQVAKEIGAMGAVLKGKVHAILITGGIAYDQDFVSNITEMVEHIAPVITYPGEDEMKALASNGLMVLEGEVKAMEYV